MSDAIRALADLSPRERLALIEELWDSLDDTDIPVTAAQKAELDRRIARDGEDETAAVTWERLRTEMLRRRT